MNSVSCPQEASITHAARIGCWDESAKAHIAGCAHCREIAQVAEWLQEIAGVEKQMDSLPDAEQVWLKAHILAKEAAREKALRPVAIAELAIRIAITLALAGGIVWIWPRIQSISITSLPWHRQMPQPIPLSLAALAICLIILVLLKLLEPVLVED